MVFDRDDGFFHWKIVFFSGKVDNAE
jgi:hypothetical protein